MSKKRSGASAGINMHVKREDHESGRGDLDDESPEGSEVLEEAPQRPLQKKMAKRSWLSSSNEGEAAKNPFANTGAKFGATSGLSFSATAFGGAAQQNLTSSAPSAGNSLFSGFGASNAKPEPITSAAAFAAPNASVPVQPTPATSLFTSSGNTKTSASSSMLVPSATLSASSQKPNNGAVKDEESYYRTMAALNTSFLQWVDSKLKENADASLVNGVRMYIDHCSRISTENSESKVEEVSKPAKPAAASLFAAAPTTSGQGLKLNEVPATSESSKPTLTGSIFPATSTNLSQPSLFSQPPSNGNVAPSLFSSSASNSTSGSIFSQPTSSAPASLFSGGGSTLFPSTSTGSSLFSGAGSSGSLFSNQAPASKAGDDDGDEGGEEGDDEVADEPSKQAQKAKNDDEEVLFEADPAKIMVFKDKAWTDRGGKGRMLVTRDKKSNKFRVVLRAGTTGKLYFNAPLNSTMKTSLQHVKKSVALMTISYNQDDNGTLQPDNDGKPSLYRFMVQTEDQALQLKEALEKAMSG